jgi:hypothetical protein
MKDPLTYYGAMEEPILCFKRDTTTPDDVKSLLRNIVDLLGKWYEVFSILGKAERTPDRFVALSLAIRTATQKHRLLGLPKTPKFHIIESHAEELEEEMPLPLYEVKKEFVEQNHQLGHKEEGFL